MQCQNARKKTLLIQYISVVEQILHVRLHLDARDTVVSKAQELCSHQVHHLLRGVDKQYEAW